MRAKIVDFICDSLSGTQRLTLTIRGDFRTQYEDLKDKELEISLKPYRPKRSLDANAYCWVLIGELAEKLNLPPKEIYRKAIREIGVWQDIELNQEAVHTIDHIWSNNGIGWFTEKVDNTRNGVIVRLFYGSSVYNSKQMSRLIDYIVDECKQQGIDTRSPEEISAIMSRETRCFSK